MLQEELQEQAKIQLYEQLNMADVSISSTSGVANLAYPDRFFPYIGWEKRVWYNSNSCLLPSIPKRWGH